MLASFTTFFHRATSSCMNEPNTSGLFGFAGSIPIACSFSTTSGSAQDLHHLRVHPLDDRARRPARHRETEPRRHHEIRMTQLGRRRYIGQVRVPLRVEHRERPELARPDVRFGEDEPERHELHARR